MLDPEGELQEIPSSDDDDVDASELRGRIQKLASRGAGIESPEMTSPIGSPPEDSVLSAKGRFLELKRMMQEDKKARRSKRKAPNVKAVSTEGDDVESFEEIEGPDPDDWEMEGSISPASYHDDVDQLLKSYRTERAGERDLSVMSFRMESHPKMLEVCQQLRERDQNILSLESKVLELDRTVIDLQDTLAEKEKLLNSKNDAVNCMVAQYQQKIADRDVELSKTQKTLFDLEKKFGSADDHWKTEKERLNAEIKQQSLRIKDLEDTNKLLESARVEQTSRDIDLEEKLTLLKEDRDRLTQENVQIRSQLDENIAEKGALEENFKEKEKIVQQLKEEIDLSAKKAKEVYEEKLVKIKKQFALKLKSVKESAESETIQGFQNQVKDLQEQLNLKTAEVDELNRREKELQQQPMADPELLVELRTHNSHLQSELEEMKRQMLELSEKEKEYVIKPEILNRITSLESRIEELEDDKLKLVSELEGYSQLRQEKEDSEKDFNERLGEYERNFEKTVDDYEKRIEEHEKASSEQKAELDKSKEQMTKMKKQFQAKLKAARDGQQQQSQPQMGSESGDNELQSKCVTLENRIAQLEEEKGNHLYLQEELNQFKLDKETLEKEYDAALLSSQQQIEEFKIALEKASEQITLLESQVQAQRVATTVLAENSGDGWGWESESTSGVTELDSKIAQFEEEKGNRLLLEEELARMKIEHEVLENNLKETSLEHEAKIKELEGQLAHSTEQLAKMKKQFQIKLKQLRDGKTLSPSPSSSPNLDTEAQAKITTLENRVAELEEEKGNLQLQLVNYDEQQAQRTVPHQSEETGEETVRLEIALAEREEEVRKLKDQLSELAEALNQKNGEVEGLMKNCSEMERSLQQNIEELSTSISTKEDEINTQLSTMEQQLSTATINLAEKEQEVQDLKSKLIETEARFNEMNALVQEYQGMVDGVRKQDKDDLTSLQDELDFIRQKATTAEESFEAMKASYSAEHEQLKTQVVNLEEHLAKLQEDCNNKTEQLLSLKGTQDRKDADFNSQIETLSAQLASYEIEIDELKAKADNTMQTVDLNNTSSAAELEEKEREFKYLEQQLMDDIGTKNDEISSLKYQLENSKSELESSLVPLREEVDRLKTLIGELTSLSENQKTELESWRSYYSTAEANYAQLYTQFEQLQGADSSRHEQVLTLQGQITEYQTQIMEIQANATKLEQEKANLETQTGQLLSESEALRHKLAGLTNEYIQLTESTESKDAETQRLRQDADTLQTEYSHSNNELKLKISSLMDQLNECESEISVVSARLKESDEVCVEARNKLEEAQHLLDEKSRSLEERTKALEHAESTLFEKSEEVIKLEEKLKEMEQQHQLALQVQVAKYTDDMEATYDQLVLTANENVSLKDKLQKQDQAIADLGQQNSHLAEVGAYKEKISVLEAELQSLSSHYQDLQGHDSGLIIKIEDLLKELEDKKQQINQLSVQVQELGNVQVVQMQTQSASVQNIWGPNPPSSEDPLSNLISRDREEEQEQFQAQSVIELQVKDLRIQELQGQVTELAMELGELRSLRDERQNLQTQNLWGPPSSTPALVPPQGQVDSSSPTQGGNFDEQIREKDRKIYELEVQLEEMQINIDDSNSQVHEMTELKMSLEVLQYKIRELEGENEKLKQEISKLRRQAEETSHSHLVPTPIPVPTQPQQLHPVVEPEILRTSAYVTTDPESDSANAKAALENAVKEIKELKVKNGKTIQRFKQLKDKYDAVVKENEAFKSKKEFSLDSAFEDEFLSQMKVKDSLIEEKGKLLCELQTENQRLTEKVDLLERGTDRLTEMKEEQDRQIQSLLTNRRSLETEVSALKWKVEELENISLARVSTDKAQQPQGSMTSQEDQGYFDLEATNSAVQENVMLRQQSQALFQEVETLRRDIQIHRKAVDDLNERNQQLEEEIEKMQELQIERRVATPTPNANTPSQIPPPPAIMDVPNSTIAGNNQQETLASHLTSLQQQLTTEQHEKTVLERKITLLQNKISEIEVSEIKCYEESLMLKSWTRQLEMDNLKVQRELERIYASIQGGDTSNVKVKVLQDEVMRLVDSLHDRDKRCEQLTLDITKLLEERDSLHLKLSLTTGQPLSITDGKGKEIPSFIPIPPTADKYVLLDRLQELEQVTYSMGIDLRREREARRLVQEQLFFSGASRMYPASGNQSQRSSLSGSGYTPPPRRSQTQLPVTPTTSVPPPTSWSPTHTQTQQQNAREALPPQSQASSDVPLPSVIPSPSPLSISEQEANFQQQYLEMPISETPFQMPVLPLPVPPEGSGNVSSTNTAHHLFNP